MSRLAVVLAWGLIWSALQTSPLAAAPIQRGALDVAYREELAKLAAKCDELKLSEQAALTRQWSIQRLPDRQYLFLPPERDFTVPKAGAPELVRKWHEKFIALRAAQADKLFALSQDALAASDSTLAYQLLFEVLREQPDHAQARRILGYQQVNGVWRWPGASPIAKRATLAHGFVKSFAAGSYWRVSTPHFQIATSVSPDAGMRLGEELEMLHTVWRQAFVGYWTDADSLQAQFANGPEIGKPVKQHSVVLFRTRAEYTANLAAAEPRLAVTQGIYRHLPA